LHSPTSLLPVSQTRPVKPSLSDEPQDGPAGTGDGNLAMPLVDEEVDARDSESPVVLPGDVSGSQSVAPPVVSEVSSGPTSIDRGAIDALFAEDYREGLPTLNLQPTPMREESDANHFAPQAILLLAAAALGMVPRNRQRARSAAIDLFGSYAQNS
jgi:hypothetical protein